MLQKTDSQNKKPSNVKVTRKNRDERRDSSHPTTDEIFTEKYNDSTGKRILEKSNLDNEKSSGNQELGNTDGMTIDRSRKSTPRIKSNTNFNKKTLKVKTGLSATDKVRRKVKVLRAAYIIVTTCGILYVIQVGFWIFAMVGLAVEAGSISAGDISGGNIITKTVADLIGFAFPGEHIFILGWIVSSVFGVMQLFIALGIFFANGVNPLRGNALKNFGLTFAVYFLPLGLIPWGLFWILGIVLDSRKK